MNDREAQLARLHKILSQRAHAWELVDALKKKLIPAEKELASLEQSANQLIQALYPSTLPALPAEHEGRAFRNENGELLPAGDGELVNPVPSAAPVAPVPVAPQQTNDPKPELTIQTEPVSSGQSLEQGACKFCGVTIRKHPTTGIWYHHAGNGFCYGASSRRAEPQETNACVHCGDPIYKGESGSWYHTESKSVFCAPDSYGIQQTAEPGKPFDVWANQFSIEEYKKYYDKSAMKKLLGLG